MITYIIKSSLSLLLLFGLYWFLLRKEKLFVFNRYFLIFSVVSSLLVPFISIPVNFHIFPQMENIIPAYDYIIPEISIVEYNTVPPDVFNNQTYAESQHFAIDSSSILFILYFSGVILFLVRFLRNIYLILRRTRSSEKISYNWYRIVLTNDKTGPCCFFRSIFLNRDDYLNSRIDKELIDHELEHIRQSHTIDIILIELVKIFYWFNPVHILYDRAIRINHEYLADNGVITDNYDIERYLDKLIGFIVGKSNIPLTSGSNHSLTKKRLLMMTKAESRSSVNGLRIAITLSLMLVLTLLLSFKQSNVPQTNVDLGIPSIEYSNSIKAEQQDQIKSTMEGVSQELLAEYQNILDKYRSNKNGQNSFSLNVKPSDKARLEAIFLQMSKKQQSRQLFVFVPESSLIIPKIVPTKEQIESFKNPQIYGVWINGKHVTNEALNKYINTDFSQVSVSKLMKNATDYGSFSYQVNLMTNDSYRNYYDKTIAKKANALIANPLRKPYSSLNMVDFSGKWVLNRSKGKSFLTEVASNTIVISQDKDTVILDITIIPDKNTSVHRIEKYVFNKSVVKKNINGDKITTITCTPAYDGQTFSITEALSNTQNGIVKESKRVSVYSLGKDGRTMIINQYDTLPEGSATPEEARHETRVYDKSN